MALSQHNARHELQKLMDDYRRLTDDERKVMSEEGVVHQFIKRLLKDVLGWPMDDPARCKYELYVAGGRPDIVLEPEKGGKIYVEAKRFGKIDDLPQHRKTLENTIKPGQLAMPGMIVDRTPEEQQAINYAFNNNGHWAILTNFEKLRLFNARRDWLVLSFETLEAYKDDFDLLWQLNYDNILNKSLEHLNNQRYTEEVDTVYLAFINEWREKLAQDILERRKYNPWAFEADGSVKLPTLRAAVQRYLDRLVIIRFAEDHYVLEPGTLRRIQEAHFNNPYTYSLDEFIDKFFRRFDELHNSALFSPDVADQANFSDKRLAELIQRLYDARYRAMSADILGNTYEQYLGKALAVDGDRIVTRDNLETRKKQGSYYTPQVIVRYIVDNSLGRYLYGTANGKPDGEPLEGETRKTAADITDLRVLDSACGSGSFLIYAFYVLAEFYQAEYVRLTTLIEADRRGKDLLYQPPPPIQALIEEARRIQNYPRLILETHLYGVDLDPQAAEIAVVNLMMRALETARRIGSKEQLPLILNQSVKVGNSLVGMRPDDPRLTAHAADLAAVRKLRAELISVPHDDPRHDAIITELAAATDALKARFEPDYAKHFTDPERVRPFHWGIEFPEAFYNPDGTLKDNPGFTIVIGNPPWEILKPDLREFYAQFDEKIESRYTREQVETRIAELQAEDPARQRLYEAQTQAITQTAAFTRAGGDYTRQGRGDPATHKLFMERMYSLMANGARLGYVVPSGIYTDLGTKDLREMLLNEGNIQYIYSFSNERFFFPGVDHRFKFALIGAEKGRQTDGFWATFRFNPRVAVKPDEFPAFIADRNNLFYMRRESIEKFSPESLSVMEFQNKRDYEISEKIYGQHPLLGQEIAGCWNAKFTAEFHITNDRALFNKQKRGLPMYEGKSIHQFDPYYDEPQFWLEESPAAARLSSRHGVEAGALDYLKPRLAYRGIARSTDERTLMTTILPPRTFAEGRTATTVIQKGISAAEQLYLSACMNSFVLDYVLRQKVAANVNMFHIYSLPIPRLTAGNPYFDALVPRAARLTCTREEFAPLWEEVMGGTWDASKGATDADERQRLRDEIDALVAHLYGLNRDEFAHILDTFPLVFPETDAGHARKSRLLATFDTLTP